MTERITPEQAKQFKRFHEDAGEAALERVKPDKRGLQCLIENGGAYQAYVVEGIRRFATATPNYDLAYDILGSSFISPLHVMEHFDGRSRCRIQYSADTLERLYRTLPNQKDLEWCKDNSMILVPGPPEEKSLLEIRRMGGSFEEDENDGGWYARRGVEFSRKEKIGPRWIAVRTKPVGGTVGKDESMQEMWLEPPTIVPTVVEVVWALFLANRVRDWFFVHHPVATESGYTKGFFGSSGDRVCVAKSQHAGWGIGWIEISKFSFLDKDQQKNTGLAGGRRF